MFTKKTVKDISVKDKRILVRADFNVPFDEKGNIYDTYRVDQSFATLKYLCEHGAKVIIISHLGRPDGKADKRFSLYPVYKYLNKQFEGRVSFVHDCIGLEAERAVGELKSGYILLLENLRFYPEEEKNDKGWRVLLIYLSRTALVSFTVHMPRRMQLPSSYQVLLVCCWSVKSTRLLRSCTTRNGHLWPLWAVLKSRIKSTY
jgi:3-phosphoglycerate kinase